jgi:hypothetical protein
MEIVGFIDIRIFTLLRYYKSFVGLPIRLLKIESIGKAAF